MKTIDGVLVTIREVAAEIKGVADYLGHQFHGEGEEDICCDVRLRVHGGTWELLSGDSQYDQDHRGYWGGSSIKPGAGMRACRDVARDLIDQAADEEASNAE